METAFLVYVQALRCFLFLFPLGFWEEVRHELTNQRKVSSGALLLEFLFQVSAGGAQERPSPQSPFAQTLASGRLYLRVILDEHPALSGSHF